MKIAKEIKEIVDTLKEVLKSEGIEYNEFVNQFLGKLEDKGIIARMHASTNPYIPRNLRVNLPRAAMEIKEKLMPYL